MKFKKATAHKQARGYALVGMMAALAISMIVLAGAAPQIKFESQREREAEMLWRGQEIAAALAQYRQARGGQLPTSLEELVEGVNLGAKKIRFLRPHALCDPMEPCTNGKSNWRLVHPGDPVIASMMQSLQAYAQKKQEFPQLLQRINAAIGQLQAYAPRVQLPGQLGGETSLAGATPGAPGQDGQPPATGVSFADSSFGGLKSEQGPIVGVVSRSPEKMVRNMLDIEEYDKGLFYAGAIVIAGGFFTPYYAGTGAAPSVNPCPNGGFLIPDQTGQLRCFGGIQPGPQVRTPQ